MSDTSAERFGPYLLDALIAKGDAADVWSATREGTGTPVIIKRLLPPWTREPSLQRIFLEVIKDTLPVRHLNLISLLDFGQEGELLYVVFEKVDGVFLKQILRSQEILEVSQVMAMVAGILRGLSFLHKATNPFTGGRLVHGDLSPINVLIDMNGQPRIADMGFTRVVLEGGLPGKPAVPDPRYMAPEVKAGGPMTPRSDVFGAGMVLNDLAGLLGDKEIVRYDKVRERATADDPEERYADADAMYQDLAPILPDRETIIGSILAENVEGWAGGDGTGATVALPFVPDDPVSFLRKRYQIISELGRGAMGIVLHARDKTLDEELAIKVLSSDHPETADDIARFRRELKLARQVNHRNVARVFHLDEGPGFLYYTMEYVPGTTLEDKVAKDGPLSPDEGRRVFAQVAAGLAAIHAERVIHRDLKPANVMIQADGRAVIMDFGVAKQQGEEMELTRTGTALGTPVYMAPEQMAGETMDERADLFSLGVMMYEALTGKDPFEGDTHVALYLAKFSRDYQRPRDLVRAIPRKLEKVIIGLLEPKPDARFKSAREVADKLG